MRQYYLAIDIGASNGRHMLGWLEEGKLKLEEVYRFENGMKKSSEGLIWDVEHLFEEILHGMEKCKAAGKIPASVGIDTWAVDYVLLDKEGSRLGDLIAYRNDRTEGMDKKVYEKISQDELYERTGIQKQVFNTIYQLMSVKIKHPEQLNNAQSLLLVPDYFHYLLSGVKANEYTNATTTQLVDPSTKDWDFDLIERLGYPKRIFGKIANPGTVLGNLLPDIQKRVGYDCRVVLPATHDTASAVAAVPSSEEDPLYISSGTWSLMGIELAEANLSAASREKNFTNEGGYGCRFRYLKNIMGLWMIQSVKKEMENDRSYAQLCEAASQEAITSRVDCNDQRFLSPDSMTNEIRDYLRETGQALPASDAQLAAVIYNSLAWTYSRTVGEIEGITGKTYDTIHVIGGGSNAAYLNKLTARYAKKKVVAGPKEASAIGNVIVQAIAHKELESLKEARRCVQQSFEIKEDDEGNAV